MILLNFFIFSMKKMFLLRKDLNYSIPVIIVSEYFLYHVRRYYAGNPFKAYDH